MPSAHLHDQVYSNPRCLFGHSGRRASIRQLCTQMMHFALQRIYTGASLKVEYGWRCALTQAYSETPPPEFIPIKALEQKDGDMYFVFIMNSRPVFAEPVNDPVFQADVPFSTVQSYQTAHTYEATVLLPSYSLYSSSLF